jgi:hypothetical protein
LALLGGVPAAEITTILAWLRGDVGGGELLSQPALGGGELLSQPALGGGSVKQGGRARRQGAGLPVGGEPAPAAGGPEQEPGLIAAAPSREQEPAPSANSSPKLAGVRKRELLRAVSLKSRELLLGVAGPRASTTARASERSSPPLPRLAPAALCLSLEWTSAGFQLGCGAALGRRPPTAVGKLGSGPTAAREARGLQGAARSGAGAVGRGPALPCAAGPRPLSQSTMQQARPPLPAPPTGALPCAAPSSRMLASCNDYSSHWTPYSLWATAARSSQARSAASRNRSGIAFICQDRQASRSYRLTQQLSAGLAVSLGGLAAIGGASGRERHLASQAGEPRRQPAPGTTLLTPRKL